MYFGLPGAISAHSKKFKKLILALVIFCVMGTGYAQLETITLNSDTSTELVLGSDLFLAGAEDFPTHSSDIEAWKSSLTAVKKVSLFGGSYWLVSKIRNDSNTSSWVLDPNGSIINKVDAKFFGQSFDQSEYLGYQTDYQYLLHYGKRISLNPGDTYTLVAKFESPYFASFPSFRVMPLTNYVKLASRETALTMFALGALFMLAIYNLFVFLKTKDLSLLYYSLYLLAYAAGWALTFNVGAHLFGFHDLRWHYVPFFLLPVFNILFYLKFLQLDRFSPTLAKLSKATIWLSLLLLPSCFFALKYAHSLATLVIGLFVTLAFLSGISAWRRGFYAATYFVVAFSFLLLPAIFILPGNIGLLPDIPGNTELLTLLGGLIDGLLLAFALAERINQLQRDKDAEAVKTKLALEMAYTDALTQIGNRQAFETDLQNVGSGRVLVLMDLDGLKQINDFHGHSNGDRLLQNFADTFRHLPQGCTGYRLGGDEFVILGTKENLPAVESCLAESEKFLHSIGFPEAGISYGVASFGESGGLKSRLVELADSRMYQSKLNRRSSRLNPSRG